MLLPFGLDVEWGVEGFEGPRQDPADVVADPAGSGVPVERLLDDALKVSAGNASYGSMRFSMPPRRLRNSTLGVPCAAADAEAREIGGPLPRGPIAPRNSYRQLVRNAGACVRPDGRAHLRVPRMW